MSAICDLCGAETSVCKVVVARTEKDGDGHVCGVLKGRWVCLSCGAETIRGYRLREEYAREEWPVGVISDALPVPSDGEYFDG